MLGDAHAPGLIDVEITETLRGLVRGAKLELSAAERAREELAQLGVRRHPDAALLSRAWQLRDTCTTYDALYVALAEGLDATLITRDAPLASGVEALVDGSSPLNRSKGQAARRPPPPAAQLRSLAERRKIIVGARKQVHENYGDGCVSRVIRCVAWLT